ncbi:Mpo1-like protein [Bermanella sp. WJH001]|uniref:DUF962 domain-containing protein n=1 Tax=Bermanella sp. WJH001 TaxID=3048005 RepID=UPI0024BDB77F|nr:DUF962 domain-containing protein [Bermanella sp. WJH001]MDJ1538255.1 DUF962 domain-containing protein [Bermanella sp. WJH001]
MTQETRITSFKEFYPFYLAEHSNTTCRVLHYVGSSLVLALLAYSLITAQYSLLWLLPVVGYGFAWVGHFFYEYNRPATFQYPLYSFASDWVMLAQAVTGTLPKEHFRKTQQAKDQSAH